MIVSDNLRTQTIQSVTNANPLVLTTVSDHGYRAGLMVTFLVPPMFGMSQINSQVAQVLSVTNNTLTINLNSTDFTPFAYPSPLPGAYTNPSVVPYSSGPVLTQEPLPYGNETTFEGVIYNDGVP